jgi:hypothetical protein
MTGLYNGTVDVLFSRVLDTENTEEPWNVLYPLYREGKCSELFNRCTCDEPKEEVEIAVDYGCGSSWNGIACRRCLHVVGPLSPYEIEQINVNEGLPDWWPSQKEEAEVNNEET